MVHKVQPLTFDLWVDSSRGCTIYKATRMPRASGLYGNVVFLGGKTGLDFSLVDKCQVTSGTVWTQGGKGSGLRPVYHLPTVQCGPRPF